MGSADHEWIDGGITAVPGILAAGLHAGIKPAPARDLALIYSSNPATAAAEMAFHATWTKGPLSEWPRIETSTQKESTIAAYTINSAAAAPTRPNCHSKRGSTAACTIR